MNTIGIALKWCIVQITLLGLLAAGLYLAGPPIASGRCAPVAFSSLAMVVILSAVGGKPLAAME